MTTILRADPADEIGADVQPNGSVQLHVGSDRILLSREQAQRVVDRLAAVVAQVWTCDSCGKVHVHTPPTFRDVPGRFCNAVCANEARTEKAS